MDPFSCTGFGCKSCVSNTYLFCLIFPGARPGTRFRARDSVVRVFRRSGRFTRGERTTTPYSTGPSQEKKGTKSIQVGFLKRKVRVAACLFLSLFLFIDS